MKVRVYWNLTKGCWSVQDAGTRRVIGHASRVLIREAGFTVSEAGRQRVLATGHKNVHAFVVGELEAADWFFWDARTAGFDWKNTPRANNAYAAACGRLGVFVSYNPRIDKGFVHLMGTHRMPVQGTAGMAYLSSAKGKAALMVFDPCDMTAAESAAATA